MNEIAEYKIEPYHDLSDAVTTIERIAKVKQFGQSIYDQLDGKPIDFSRGMDSL